jgi:alpha-tubulin suppressor-like RCC1 family protein
VVRVWIALALFGVVVGSAAGEQASEPYVPESAGLDVGAFHSCAVLSDGSVRCWGLGVNGQLGYGNRSNVGDVDTPASVGPVHFGPGRTVKAIAAGDYHTCAILDDGSVRCWGFGGNGRLGYGNQNDVLDPSSVGAVNLGPGRTARAITAGGAHTCAILDDGTVRCWGFGGGGYPIGGGELGYGNTNNVGDKPGSSPGAAGPVYLGAGRTAVAISAGEGHTCAILDDGSVLCWGQNYDGQLGYGNTSAVGDTATNTPGMVGPVGLGRPAVAISAGGQHTCAILDDGTVRCWGSGVYGELGYGNTSNVGYTAGSTPATAGPVYLGQGARAISAGAGHTCAVLDDGSMRCWGWGEFGRLGYPTLDSYGNQPNIGDAPTDTPGMVGPVALGAGRTAVAISAGGEHTCARLDDGSVRCWGHGLYGRLGYCSNDSVGETNAPGSVGPVNLAPGDGGTSCPGSGTPPPSGGPGPNLPGGGQAVDPARLQALRAEAWRRCLARAAHRPRHQRARARADCLRIYGRTPGPITGLLAFPGGTNRIELVFDAAGSDGQRPPPARGYLIEQSRHPIRTQRDFVRAHALCSGDCEFAVAEVGDIVSLTIMGLRPHTTYYYAIKARDNVTSRCGPRSATVKATTGSHVPSGPGQHNHGSPPPQPIHNHRAAVC